MLIQVSPSSRQKRTLPAYQGGSLLAARASVRCRGSDAEIPEGSPPYEDPPSSECQGMVWAGPDSACPRPSPAWRQWSHPQHGVG